MQSQNFATKLLYDSTLRYTLRERYLAKRSIRAIKLASGRSGELDAGGDLFKTCLSWERERYLVNRYWNGVHMINAGLLGGTNTYLRLAKADNRCS
jgi:hypothetical protein